MNGFVPINRKLFSHPFWKEERIYSKAEAWIDLIQSVRFEASSVIVNDKLIDLQKGEMVASRRFLEKRWGWGNSKIRTFLKLLESTQMLTQRSTHGQTVIKLVNYKDYNGSQPAINPENNQRSTQNQPTANPKENKDKKENKGKNTKTAFQPPNYPEFESYLLEQMPKLNPDWTPERISRAARLQFDTYEDNSWKDGNNKQVKNWKTKSKNAMSYKKPWQFGSDSEEPQQTSQQQKLNYL